MEKTRWITHGTSEVWAMDASEALRPSRVPRLISSIDFEYGDPRRPTFAAETPYEARFPFSLQIPVIFPSPPAAFVLHTAGSSMPSFVNFSAYKFTPFEMEELPALKARLLAVTNARALRGTILLSTEGINFFVAGSRVAMDELLVELRTIRGLADLQPKKSESDEQPFNRMLVKIKKEIIAFGVEGIDPARRPSTKLPARQLKQWLDEGRPVTLLDTRNDYEVRMGTFQGAVRAGIDHFRDFPASVAKLPAELKEQPIVMFCTGGIRCEKAGPFMEQVGFKNVFQLDGGILKYFEECGGAHYDGECFVFDRRVGVDPALQETNSVLCFNCQMPLTEAEQRHPHYVADISCPHCINGKRAKSSERLNAEHAEPAEFSRGRQ